MSEMPEGVANAVRTRRTVRDADFRDRCITRDQRDPSFVNLGIRAGGLRDALRRHDNRSVVAIDPNRLVAGRNGTRGAQVVDPDVARLPCRVRRFPTRNKRDIHAAIGDGRGFRDATVGVRPHRHRDARGRPAGRMRPLKKRLRGASRGTGVGFRCPDMGYGH
jgi:hypothetical protein